MFKSNIKPPKKTQTKKEHKLYQCIPLQAEISCQSADIEGGAIEREDCDAVELLAEPAASQ